MADLTDLIKNSGYPIVACNYSVNYQVTDGQ